jgi:hypothetical protein
MYVTAEIIQIVIQMTGGLDLQEVIHLIGAGDQIVLLTARKKVEVQGADTEALPDNMNSV